MMEALALGRAPLEHLDVLGGRVVVAGLPGHLKMRFDDVSDVIKHNGCPLLTVGIDREAKALKVAPLHGPPRSRCRDLRGNLVAPDGLEADRPEDVDAVDHPRDGGLPVDRFKDPARRRRGHNIVGDPFDLHFRACEAGVFAPNMQFDTRH